MEQKKVRYLILVFGIIISFWALNPLAFAAEFNVKDYGAVGDGIVDDGPAIQSALNAIPSEGGSVYLPSGTYKVTAPINIRKANISFIGEDKNKTTIVTDGLHQTLVVQPLVRPISNILIKNIRFTNPAAAASRMGHGRGTVQLDSYTKAITNVTITDIVIDDTPLVGIVVGADNVSITNNSIRDTGQHGIYLSVSNNVSIENNDIQGIATAGSGLANQSGIKVKISNNVLIKNNRLRQFRSNSFGILVSRSSHSVSLLSNLIALSDSSQVGLRLHSNTAAKGNIIDGGDGFSGSTAIDIKEGSDASISDTRITGSWIAPPVIVRSPAIDTQFDNVTVTSGSATGWQFDLKSSTQPVIQNSRILSGGYGINLGKSIGAKILHNIINVSKKKYSSGLARDFTLIDGNQLVLNPQ